MWLGYRALEQNETLDSVAIITKQAKARRQYRSYYLGKKKFYCSEEGNIWHLAIIA